jgi:hypothetical protein
VFNLIVMGVYFVCERYGVGGEAVVSSNQQRHGDQQKEAWVDERRVESECRGFAGMQQRRLLLSEAIMRAAVVDPSTCFVDVR